MIINFNPIKTYMKLLIKYVFYDFKLLIYVFVVLTAVFFQISYILSQEINKHFADYGGVNESLRSYRIDVTNIAPGKELDTLFKILEKYQVQEIKDIEVKMEPLFRVDTVSCNNTANIIMKENQHINGRNFTDTELKMGAPVIILSLEDYMCYFSEYKIGDFIQPGSHNIQIIGIDSTADYSKIPLEYLLNDATINVPEFEINYLVLVTQKPLAFFSFPLIKKSYQKILLSFSSSYKNAELGIYRLFWDALVDIYNSMLDYILYIFLITGLSILCIFQTCQVLYYKNLSHQETYIISGASIQFLKNVVRGEAAFIILSAFLLSQFLLLWWLI